MVKTDNSNIVEKIAIRKAAEYVDEYKIGKINNYNGLDKKINWNKFLEETVFLLRQLKKNFYIKYDLRAFAAGIKLYGNECLMDEWSLEWQSGQLQLL